MSEARRQIEVDAETADLLEARALALGLSVPALLADIAGNSRVLSAELSELRARQEGPWSPESLQEDARRLAEFERTRVGVPWAEVEAWMRSWGKPGEVERPISRKL